MLQKVKHSEENKKILRNIVLVVSIIALFIFLVAFSVYYVSEHVGHGEVCTSLIPVPIIVVLLASLGFFIGTFTYYILSTRFVMEKEQVSQNAGFTLNFLPKDEKTLVQLLIRESPLTQASLAKRAKISRVQVHRVIKRLLDKGVIEKTPKGIELKEELQELF